MKNEFYKSRFLIAALIVSMLGVWASNIPSFMFTFFLINITCSFILAYRLYKS